MHIAIDHSAPGGGEAMGRRPELGYGSSLADLGVYVDLVDWRAQIAKLSMLYTNTTVKPVLENQTCDLLISFMLLYYTKFLANTTGEVSSDIDNW